MSIDYVFTMAGYESASDADLMRATAAGDDEAFSELVRRHQQAVYGTCWKLLAQRHSDAEDVAQQVFVKVYRAAGRYREEAQFRTWLMTIVRNTVFSHLQSSRRHHEHRVDWSGTEGNEESCRDFTDPQASDPAATAMTSELQEVLDAALAALPDPQRTALVLQQYEQMDYAEIARVMKTSVSSVKSLIFRARDSLRATVRQYREEKF